MWIVFTVSLNISEENPYPVFVESVRIFCFSMFIFLIHADIASCICTLFVNLAFHERYILGRKYSRFNL